jgi:glycosyltransferase involved in cell wall biosynthesis
VKRVLYVTENLPARMGPGGAVVNLETIRALGRGGWSVHLVLNVGPEHVGGVPEARSWCDDATVVVQTRRRRRLSFRRALACLRRHGYWPRGEEQVWKAVDRLLRDHRFDLVLLDNLCTGEYGRLAKEQGHRVPVVLRAHNVEHALLASGLRYRREKALETRARIHRLRAMESNLARYCDLTLAISDVDRAHLAALNPGFPVETIPAIVDTEHYRPAAARPTGKELVFIGGLRWFPNLDGVGWLVREVMPRVLARHPDAHLTVIGEHPPARLVPCGPGVSAVGFVPDERPLVARARAVVAPIRVGSGVRIKIVNSLAMGKAIVSTRVGAEGIPVEHGRSILLADSPEDFAGAVNRVLEDDACERSLGEDGLRLCLQHYTAAAVEGRLEEAIRSAMDATEPGPAALAPGREMVRVG